MTSDPALAWLINHPLSHTPSPSKTLWVLDEQARGYAKSIAGGDNTIFICNRFDVAQEFQNAGHHCLFTDFASDAVTPASVDYLYYRLSKEKPVVHHLFNCALKWLKPGGQLILAGLKNQGAKTYLDKAAHLLGDKKSTRKQGHAYCAQLTRTTETTAPLADDDYTTLRKITPKGQALTFMSKPGLFGWQKIDAGSAYMMTLLQDQHIPINAERLLDLGCGYGYLTLAATGALALNPSHITLTDNSAAALLAARHNSQGLSAKVQLLPSDAGDTLSGHFTCILCNPPFHQGFNVESDLTERFLANSARLLARNGSAFFVVNAFIGIEQKAARYFHTCQTLGNNRQFKVLRLSQPR